jgi:hypothetical protein
VSTFLTVKAWVMAAASRLSRSQRELLEGNMKRLGVAAVFVILILAALLVFFAPRIAAQGLFGTISGVITDPSGAVVAGAVVRVTNVNTKVAAQLMTNATGVYSATSLNPGVYDVEAGRRGLTLRW